MTCVEKESTATSDALWHMTAPRAHLAEESYRYGLYGTNGFGKNAV